jgi:hypothetical protein
LVFPLALALAGVAGAGTGTWARLPAAPIEPNDVGPTSVWTGKEMLVVGRRTTRAKDGAILERAEVAAAFNPGTGSWRRLPAPLPSRSFMSYSSVWTGKTMLVWGAGIREAFDPATNRWRQLSGSPLLSVHDGYGIVAWTGRELIGWGGGCCGDAFSDGVAYSTATNRWRALAPSPLAGSQHPIGAWTGRELIVFVGGLDPDGKPWPARLARAAAYNPRTNTWRRIAPLPAARGGASVVWDGREVLVVGGAAPGAATAARVGFAYNPATNRWRRLPRMNFGRIGAAAVWTGKQLLLWGGTTRPGSTVALRSGLAFDPNSNRWTALPRAPVEGRLEPAVAWTGRSLIVWGGASSLGIRDGAVFTPTTGD